MSFIKEVSWMSKSGYNDIELLEYIDKHFDEIECELNGEVYKEPKKRDHNFCIKCKLRKIVDYERSTLVCTKCSLCEYYPVYVVSYSHTMQPSRRKCIYERSDNFKVILNQFFYGGKKFVPDNVMETIRDEIHNETNILYNYTIPITIPILECILKRNELTMYKDSIYFIFFKLSGGSFPHITTKEYNLALNMFNVVSSIYDKYRPKGRKSFLACSRSLVAFVIYMDLSLGFVCAWVGCWLWRVSCMGRAALARSGAPGRVVGWTGFSHWRSMHGFCRNFQRYTGFVCYLFFSFWWVLGFLYVYSDHSVLGCCDLFSGVGLGVGSFFVISNYSFILKKLLIMLKKVECAKYIPQMKTHSKQNELERMWELITKDPEWAVALRK